MSFLSRRLQRSVDELNGKPTSWIVDKMEDLEIWWRSTWVHIQYYNFYNFFNNLPMFLKMAWNWRSWYAEGSVECFADMLAVHAQVLRNGWSMNAEKYYRRCKTAEGMLRRANSYEIFNDKTLKYLNNKNPMHFKFNGIHTEYVTDKKIYNAMYKIALKRVQKKEEQVKQDAWAYVAKYINQFTD